MKLLIINGPNLNLLGLREPDIYGRQDYAQLCRFVLEACQKAGVEGEVFQSNHEGAIVDRIQAAYGKFDGIVINPAAYTHTSVDSGRAEGGGHSRRGSPHLRCGQPGVFPAGLLRRHGLRQDL